MTVYLTVNICNPKEAYEICFTYTMRINCFKDPFVLRVSMAMHAERDIVIANLSFCPSVTLWYCMKPKHILLNSFHHPVGV